MNKYYIQIDSEWTNTVEADVFDVKEDGMLYFSRIDEGDFIEIAVFNKWIFCALVEKA